MSGAPIKLISAEVKCYDKFVTRRNYGNFMSNTTKVTLFNLHTSLDCRGMKSRVILKKVKNRLKFRFTKNPLEFNPCMLGRRKRHRSVCKAFSDWNNHIRVICIQFDPMAV